MFLDLILKLLIIYVGQIIKGTVLPPIHKDEETQDQKAYEDIELKPAIQKSLSCDASTQTDIKSEKKTAGCAVM